MPGPRAAILSAGLAAFDRTGFDHATVAAIRTAAGVSNGSFFHFFASKDALAAALFIEALAAYHAAMLAPLAAAPSAAGGIAAVLRSHLGFVVDERARAKFMFEQSRAEWMMHVRAERDAENERFAAGIDAWRAPHVAAGALRPLPFVLFAAQVIGPAQILCRAYLSGRSREDPRRHAAALIDCAVRALATDMSVADEETP